MTCWLCDIVLIKQENLKDWKCPKCKDIYYKCARCDELDAKENEKGIDCVDCKKHFCIMCWQNTGELIDGDSDNILNIDLDKYGDGDYLCENCLNKKCKRSKYTN